MGTTVPRLRSSLTRQPSKRVASWLHWRNTSSGVLSICSDGCTIVRSKDSGSKLTWRRDLWAPNDTGLKAVESSSLNRKSEWGGSHPSICFFVPWLVSNVKYTIMLSAKNAIFHENWFAVFGATDLAAAPYIHLFH